jgi:hypothetical protein
MPTLNKNTHMPDKTKYIILAVAVVLLLIFLLVKFPYNIKAPCFITAQKEWALIQVETDKLLSRVIDHANGSVTNYTLLQFDREDFVQINLQSLTSDHQRINKGDTIANVYSSDNHLLMVNLVGELEIARRNRSMVSSGEKTAVQEEALQALNMARIEFDAFVPQYQRKKKLYDQTLIGVEEWETTQSTYDLYQSNINRQQARLEAMQSGEKQEMIQFYEARVEQIREQLVLLQKKLDMETIISPLAGTLTTTGGDSILCRVERFDTLLLKIALPAPELKYTLPGQNISVFAQETGKTYTASIIKIRQRSQLINGTLKYIITGKIENPALELMPGMSGLAKIHGESVTLYGQFVRALNRYIGFSLL